jgi:hypothetical protein
LETTQESLPDKSLAANVPASLAIEPRVPATMAATPLPSRLSLPPKGACWYCDKPLDSVKRFCGKTCSDAFDEEAEFTR